jgi:hypothetical protein
MFGNDFHCLPDITALPAFGPNQLGSIQIEFDFAIPQYFRMGRLVIIDKMTTLKPSARYIVTALPHNPSRWVF